MPLPAMTCCWMAVAPVGAVALKAGGLAAVGLSWWAFGGQTKWAKASPSITFFDMNQSGGQEVWVIHAQRADWGSEDGSPGDSPSTGWGNYA
eukprot:13370848-Alexandrium_andersonii.AAC.1